MRRAFAWALLILGVAALGAFAFYANNSSDSRICARDTAKLSQFAGEYPSHQFLRDLSATRSVSEAIRRANKNGKIAALLIDDTGIHATQNWHEAEDIANECALVETDSLRIGKRAEIYSLTKADNALYFSTIFTGCFKDESNEAWCFTQGNIQIGNKTHSAELMLDGSELPPENSVRIDGAQTEFWFFRPMQDGGWQVFKGGWLTDEDAPPVNWNLPWRTLTPAPNP